MNVKIKANNFEHSVKTGLNISGAQWKSCSLVLDLMQKFENRFKDFRGNSTLIYF